MELKNEDANHTESANLETPVIDIDTELSQGFAANFIHRKASQLIGQSGISPSDYEDLEQEMKMRLWQRFSHFDPQKGSWHIFVITVVERHAATIRESVCRLKRLSGESPVSLSEMVEDCDNEPTELGEIVQADHREAITGRYVETFENLSDLKITVAEVMETLPDDLRRLCELLKFCNVTEAAQKIGIPRTTASSMISRLRKAFVKAGLGDIASQINPAGGSCDE